jgi:hypothetical protein
MRKIEMQSLEDLIASELGSIEAYEADESTVSDDFGLDYEAWEELAFGSRELERDLHRWELDPASAEDFLERNRGWKLGPALKWRHFGH